MHAAVHKCLRAAFMYSKMCGIMVIALLPPSCLPTLPPYVSHLDAD